MTKETRAPSEFHLLGKRVFAGSLIQFFGRFSFRGLKFVRTIVIAKLLFPQDIGLFALVGLCLGFADIFVQTGFQSALVEREHLDRRHLNGAWTIHVVKGLVLASLASLLAPWIASFFHEPQLVSVLRVMSLTLALDGFVNIGAVLLQKELKFGTKLLYDFTYVFAEILGVIIAVFFIHSVWALVIGALIGQVTSIIFSYVFHPYRPWFTLDFSGARELFHFGKWVSLASILTFFISKGDGITISKFIGVEELGYYQLAFSLAMLPGLEIVRALGAIFFPLFSRLKGDRKELRHTLVRIARVVLVVVLPIIVGLSTIADSFVRLLYGERWLPLVPILMILLLYASLKSIEYFLTPIILGMGHPKYLTVSTALNGGVLLLLLVPAALRYGVTGVAWCLVLGAFISSLYLMIQVYALVGLTLRHLVSIVVVPCGSSLMLYEGVHLIQDMYSRNTFLSIAVGIVVYTLSVFCLDYFTGRHMYLSAHWMRRALSLKKQHG